MSLASNDHAAATDELEVGSRPPSVDLANKLARRVEDLHAVAHASVHVALAVAVDT